MTRVRRTPAILAASALLLVGAAGCSAKSKSDGASGTTTTTAVAGSTTTTGGSTTTTGATTTTGGATTTTASSATTTTKPSTASDDPGTEGTSSGSLDNLASGTHYGYFAGVENGKVEGQQVEVALWDEAQFYTGKEAVAQAHAHHAIPDDQDYVDDDYFLLNENQKVRRLAVVPDGQVTTLADNGNSPTQVPSSLDEVVKQKFLFKILVQNVRGITTITSIEAVFLP